MFVCGVFSTAGGGKGAGGIGDRSLASTVALRLAAPLEPDGVAEARGTSVSLSAGDDVAVGVPVGKGAALGEAEAVREGRGDAEGVSGALLDGARGALAVRDTVFGDSDGDADGSLVGVCESAMVTVELCPVEGVLVKSRVGENVGSREADIDAVDE